MEIRQLIVISLTLVVAVPGIAGCNRSPSSQSDFNLVFKYGVGAINELNTFQGTYTKDMISDPSITVDLVLTEEELGTIHQKMDEIDFFSYPKEFSVNLTPGELIGIVTPSQSYYFKVEYDSNIKELWWEDKITNEDEKAARLRGLIILIRDIIEAKKEYQDLQEPTSGYM